MLKKRIIPIQWVPGALSLGVKRQEREAVHSPPSTPSWRGAQLKSTGITYLTLPIHRTVDRGENGAKTLLKCSEKVRLK
jgi:hypothetical protein